jgi:hypothetical protein
MSGNAFTKIFDLKGPLDSRGEEATPRSEKGCKGRENKYMELKGLDGDCPGNHVPSERNLVSARDKHGVDIA